jgi:hypothetical protein
MGRAGGRSIGVIPDRNTLVFFFVFSLAVGLLVLYGEVSGLALYLGEFWPLLLIVLAFCGLGLAAQTATDRRAVRPTGNDDHRPLAPGAANMHRINDADAD